jgi:hypothetical protein
MNILLVSVTERTREIGLRMLSMHVLLEFLSEAVFLSVSGGLAGIVMGIACSAAIPCCSVGQRRCRPRLVRGSGWRLNPIDTLRCE